MLLAPIGKLNALHARGLEVGGIASYQIRRRGEWNLMRLETRDCAVASIDEVLNLVRGSRWWSVMLIQWGVRVQWTSSCEDDERSRGETDVGRSLKWTAISHDI